MHWWTYGERGHLLLARDVIGLRRLAPHVFVDREKVKVKAVCEIEIVAAPPQLDALRAKHRMREAVESFLHEVSARMQEAMDAGEQLPTPFAPCDSYERPEDDTDIPEDLRDTFIESHIDCVNCCCAVRLVGMTPEELYARYHSRWEAAVSKKQTTHRRPVKVPSRAPQAADGEPLWFAFADFGHHSGGLGLEEVDYVAAASDEPGRPFCVSEGVIFFFRRLADLNALKVELQGISDATDAAREARRAEEEAARREALGRPNMAAINRTLAVFRKEF